MNDSSLRDSQSCLVCWTADRREHRAPPLTTRHTSPPPGTFRARWGVRFRAGLVALAAMGTLVCWMGKAFAGTYLDAAALLLDESRRASEFVQSHLSDVQLAAVAQRLAEARVRASREMAVPPDVDKAHPHLLLALESVERAMAAAREGEAKRFFHLMAQSRQEEENFRSQLSLQHKTLPELQRCERR